MAYVRLQLKLSTFPHAKQYAFGWTTSTSSKNKYFLHDS